MAQLVPYLALSLVIFIAIVGIFLTFYSKIADEEFNYKR
jgi:hypothetical protein